MTTKNRDLVAGMIMRLATEGLPDVELIFYRTPSQWEQRNKSVAVFVGREDAVEYHPVELSDAEAKTSPMSVVAARLDCFIRKHKEKRECADKAVPRPRKKKSAPL